MLKWFAARSTFFNVCLFLFSWLLQLFSFFFDTILFIFFCSLLFDPRKVLATIFGIIFKNLLYFRNNYTNIVNKDNEMKFYIREFNLLRMHIAYKNPTMLNFFIIIILGIKHRRDYFILDFFFIDHLLYTLVLRMMQLVEENLYNKTLDDKIATKFCSSLEESLFYLFLFFCC